MTDHLSIAEASVLLRQKKLSPIELVARCLKRFQQLEPELRAVITVMPNEALKDALTAEADIQHGKWKGPLHGIPVIVQDRPGAEWSTSARYKNGLPAKDAAWVRKLRHAGAILIGSSGSHTYRTGFASLVRYKSDIPNPWNREFISGGCSPGAAAAVASGLCYAAVVADDDGSFLLSAANCGVTGMGTTHGLTCAGNGFMTGEDTPDAGIICRSAEDAAITLNTLVNPGWGQTNRDVDYRILFNRIAQPKIGIAGNFKASEEVREVFMNAVGIFRSLGCETGIVDVPEILSSGAAELDRDMVSGSLFNDVDVLILPTTVTGTPAMSEAWARGAHALSSYNISLFSHYGLPAISIPCGFCNNALPLSLQIAGPAWGDGTVLDIANRYQQATGWHLYYPTMLDAPFLRHNMQ